MSPTLITGPGVWLEGSATLQLERLAALPGCRCAVGMPDLHAGQHGPIGVAVTMDAPWPSMIGGDAGCGARVIGLPRVAMTADALERRASDFVGGPVLPEADAEALFEAAWSRGPAGLREVEGVPEALAELAGAPDGEAPSAPPPAETRAFGESLGTVGGGNHFLEVSAVESVRDRPAAARAGLVPGGMAVVAHSGSRGLGTFLASRWTREALEPTAREAWFGELRGAIRYARTNRLLLTWRMLQALGTARVSKVGGQMDIVHNLVEPTVVGGEGLWLHRKGCAPAEAGSLTVVLGSRGAHSWVMEGLGKPEALCSVAHGAGRKMTRSEAMAKVRARHSRASLTRTALGGRVMYDDPDLLYEEHPDAYKAIEPVVDALEAFGAARRVAALRPVLTVKR